MKEEQKTPCGIFDFPFERNNFYYGKLMTVRDFFAEQCYFNEKRWLINRMVNGWGVVCGLDVKWKDKKQDTVIITPGLAIDCCGREILVCEDKEVPLAPEIQSSVMQEQEAKTGLQKLLICLEYFECKTETVEMQSIECDKNERFEFNRIRDSFKIRVLPEKEVLIPRYGSHCPLFEDKFKSDAKPHPFIPEPLHRYLCENLKKGCPECPEKQCVILAEITIGGPYPRPVSEVMQSQEASAQEKIISPLVKLDTCSRRRLVYSNPMLYDLFNCYHADLPHIIDISWAKLHAREDVDWDDFAAITGAESGYQEKIPGAGLTVTFDKLMDTTTINRHTFMFALIAEESGTGYRLRKYIPGAVKHKTAVIQGEQVTQSTFFVEEDWRKDEVEGSHSEIKDNASKEDGGADFEIILRGSSILSKDKKALDGDFIGGKFPTGNGSQGGDFFSWFTLKSAPTTGRKKPAKQKQPSKSEE